MIIHCKNIIYRSWKQNTPNNIRNYAKCDHVHVLSHFWHRIKVSTVPDWFVRIVICWVSLIKGGNELSCTYNRYILIECTFSQVIQLQSVLMIDGPREWISSIFSIRLRIRRRKQGSSPPLGCLWCKSKQSSKCWDFLSSSKPNVKSKSFLFRP